MVQVFRERVCQCVYSVIWRFKRHAAWIVSEPRRVNSRMLQTEAESESGDAMRVLRVQK